MVLSECSFVCALPISKRLKWFFILSASFLGVSGIPHAVLPFWETTFLPLASVSNRSAWKADGLSSGKFFLRGHAGAAGSPKQKKLLDA